MSESGSSSSAALYHLSLPGSFDPAAAEQTCSTRGRTLAEEGFIHLCTWQQLPGVVERFYADVADQLSVLTIDPARLPPGALRFETVDGDAYPHLYAPLPTDAIIGVRPYRPDAS